MKGHYFGGFCGVSKSEHEVVSLGLPFGVCDFDGKIMGPVLAGSLPKRVPFRTSSLDP